jgi:RNA polymerase sigma-70 factor (ECF subfamily)
VRQTLGDDAELVRRCQRGDVKAFELLVARHTRFSGAVAMGVVGNYHTAKDVVQEAFVKVLASIGKLDNPERFRPWLRNVVRRTALDTLRRRKVAGRSAATLPGQDSDSAPLPADDLSPDDLMAKAELREQVREEIASLPDTQREIVMLKYLEGLSYEEIAQTCGLSVGTIESRLFRARTALRNKLGVRLGLSGRERMNNG